MADHSEGMGSRRGGWRASLTSFSPSVDSVTHPRTGTQTKRTSTCAAVISNKRMIMTLVKTPPPLSGLLSHRQTAKPLGSESPDLDQVIQSLYLHIEKAQRHYTSFTISSGQALWLTKPSGPWRRMSESARIQARTRAPLYMFMWVSEKEGAEDGCWCICELAGQ